MIASAYQPDSVLMAAGMTVFVVFALTLFAFQTKYDFTGMGPCTFAGPAWRWPRCLLKGARGQCQGSMRATSQLRCARADLFVALIVLILFGFVASIFGGPILRKVQLGFLSTVAQLYPRPRDCRSVRRLAHTTYCKRRERQEWNTTCAWLSAFAVALARSTPRPAA